MRSSDRFCYLWPDMPPVESFRPALALLTAGLALILVSQGCSSKPKPADPANKAFSKTDEQIFLGDTIERNYDPHVIVKRAEAFFDREEYPEAVVELQHFLELHRAHRLAPYAMFRMGEATLMQAKTVDRDPEPVTKAEAIFRKLRSEHPNNRYDEQAVARIRECQEWLAKTHMFVGQFYYRRGAFLAAAHRYEAILKDYPEMEVAPEAQYQLARTYEALGANEWAREQLTILGQRYPHSPIQADARKMLAKLGGPAPPAVEVASAPSQTKSDTRAAGSLFSAVTPAPASPEFPTSRQITTSRFPNSASALVTSPTFCRLGVWC